MDEGLLRDPLQGVFLGRRGRVEGVHDYEASVVRPFVPNPHRIDLK